MGHTPLRWSFKSVAADRVWSDQLGEYVTVKPEDRVHVWVFALQTCRDPHAYDPLDVDQWAFRVIPHRRLLHSGQTTARLSFSSASAFNPSLIARSDRRYGRLGPSMTESRQATSCRLEATYVDRRSAQPTAARPQRTCCRDRGSLRNEDRGAQRPTSRSRCPTWRRHVLRRRRYRELHSTGR